MAVVSKDSLFDAKITQEIFNKVKGHSALAKLSAQEPIPFVGTKQFTFTMDKEVNIVAENAQKPSGGATIAPVSMIPLKIEYGARVSDEFLFASEEERIDLMKAWVEGFAKKAARGIDIMAMHGLNPRTSTAATQTIGTNSFDTNTDVNEVTYDSSDVLGNLEEAVEAIGDYDVTGWAFSKAFAGEVGQIKTGDIYMFPEFQLGGKPDSFRGTTADVNSTVGVGGEDKAIIGDFENAFKWGIAKELPIRIIEYGNPDNDSEAGDLQAHNQIYLRSEMYVGWAILDPKAFAVIKDEG